MKGTVAAAIVCPCLLLNTLLVGTLRAQALALKLTAAPQASVRWSEIVSANNMAAAIHAGPSGTVPPRGRGPAPQPASSGSSPAYAADPSIRSGPEPARVTATSSVMSGPATLSFQALADNGTAIPPDTYGAAGPGHLMTMLNTQARVQDKSGNTISTVSLSSFWSALPSNTSTFDPRVQYDASHGRWIATCAVNPGSNTSKINFAISATGDPTGTWTFYQLPADTLETGQACWADFPCMGFNGSWIVITANMFTVTGNTFQGARMWAIDASSVVSGGSIGYKLFLTKFDVAGSRSGFTLQPCVTYGAGDTLYLVDNSGYYASNDTTFLIRLSRVTGTPANPQWSVVPNSSFAGTGLFRVTNNFNGTQIDASQQGISTLIATGDSRLLSAAYRAGRIWCTHSGGFPAKLAQAPDRTAVFWYQLNPLSMPSPIVQSGRIDGGAGVHHFFPSIAANAAGDACLGFSRSDASRFAEAVFCGRLASDPAGTSQPIQQLKAGQSSYSKFFSGSENRWGDYSNTCVDPTDDLTFWTIQEYAAQNVGTGTNDGRWGTWWGQITPQSSLPVQLASFGAEMSGIGRVRIDWVTLSEINNFGFEVQKSDVAVGPYVTIPLSFTPGHGTTVAMHRYSYTDTTALGGQWYYRLKQVDLDGAVRFSDPLFVAVTTDVPEASGPSEPVLLSNYPNPFNPSTTIRYGLPQRSCVTLAVYTTLGQQVAQLVSGEVEEGYHDVRFDASGLPSGVYFYRLQAGSYVESKKLLLVR